MKLIFIFLYIVLLTQSHSQILGKYSLVSIDSDKVSFKIEVSFEKKLQLIIPPLNFKTNKVLKDAKLVKMQAIAQDTDSLMESFSYQYEIARDKLNNVLPRSDIKYLEKNVEKFFVLETFRLPIEKKNDSRLAWLVGIVSIILFILVFFKKDKPKVAKIEKVDLQALWQTGKQEDFLRNALSDQTFSMDKKLLQDYYEQVKYAGVDLNSKQKSLIDKSFKNKKSQIKNVQKEQEDQFLASVLED